ncbi:MAG: hypothetical protein P8Z31_06890, partial [Gammaproteobacteria bacterium]
FNHFIAFFLSLKNANGLLLPLETFKNTRSAYLLSPFFICTSRDSQRASVLCRHHQAIPECIAPDL